MIHEPVPNFLVHKVISIHSSCLAFQHGLLFRCQRLKWNPLQVKDVFLSHPFLCLSFTFESSPCSALPPLHSPPRPPAVTPLSSRNQIFNLSIPDHGLVLVSLRDLTSSFSSSFPSAPRLHLIFAAIPHIHLGPFLFLIHIHVISIWLPEAAVRDCYFVLKVLKACLIYSNNLGYVQKYHYKHECVSLHTQAHTHAKRELFPPPVISATVVLFQAQMLLQSSTHPTKLSGNISPQEFVRSVAVVCLFYLKPGGKWKMFI